MTGRRPPTGSRVFAHIFMPNYMDTVANNFFGNCLYTYIYTRKHYLSPSVKNQMLDKMPSNFFMMRNFERVDHQEVLFMTCIIIGSKYWISDHGSRNGRYVCMLLTICRAYLV